MKQIKQIFLKGKSPTLIEGSSNEKFLAITINSNFTFEKTSKWALQERQSKLACSCEMCQIHENRKKTFNI